MRSDECVYVAGHLARPHGGSLHGRFMGLRFWMCDADTSMANVPVVSMLTCAAWLVSRFLERFRILMSFVVRVSLAFPHRESAMSGLLDSVAHFEARAQEVGLSDTGVRALRRHGLATLGKVAHAISMPGQPPSVEALAVWMQGNMAGCTLGDQAAFRRLIWEGGALATADLRDQLCNPDSANNCKVPEAERTRRLDALKSSHPGLLLEGPLEPSHHLLDRAAALEKENMFRYLGPEVCTSRSWEVTHSKPERKFLELDAGKLTVSSQSSVPDNPPHSALQLQECLLRRGIAFVFAQVCSYISYQRYVSQLFQHLTRDPPPGYSRCSVTQLARADRLVFEKIIERDIKPRRRADGCYPLDDALLAALVSYEVSMCLLPLAASSGSQRPGKREAPSKGQGKFQGYAKFHKGSGKGKKGS